jgi:hypothetical protein
MKLKDNAEVSFSIFSDVKTTTFLRYFTLAEVLETIILLSTVGDNFQVLS